MRCSTVQVWYGAIRNVTVIWYVTLHSKLYCEAQYSKGKAV